MAARIEKAPLLTRLAIARSGRRNRIVNQASDTRFRGRFAGAPRGDAHIAAELGAPLVEAARAP